MHLVETAPKLPLMHFTHKIRFVSNVCMYFVYLSSVRCHTYPELSLTSFLGFSPSREISNWDQPSAVCRILVAQATRAACELYWIPLSAPSHPILVYFSSLCGKNLKIMRQRTFLNYGNPLISFLNLRVVIDLTSQCSAFLPKCNGFHFYILVSLLLDILFFFLPPMERACEWVKAALAASHP